MDIRANMQSKNRQEGKLQYDDDWQKAERCGDSGLYFVEYLTREKAALVQARVRHFLLGKVAIVHS